MKNFKKLFYVAVVIAGVVVLGASSTSASVRPTLIKNFSVASARAAHPIIVVPHAPLALAMPDLVITNVEWTQVYPYSNCNTLPVSQSAPDPYVYFCVTVQNQGTSNATLSSTFPIFLMSLYKTSILPANLSASMNPGSSIVIPPGGTYQLNFNSIFNSNLKSAVGTFTYIMRLDENNAIAESNELNNTFSFSITTTP